MQDSSMKSYPVEKSATSKSPVENLATTSHLLRVQLQTDYLVESSATNKSPFRKLTYKQVTK